MPNVPHVPHNVPNIGEDVDFRIFLIVKLGFRAQEGLENDPELRCVILTEFGPKQARLDPAQVYFYRFLDLILRPPLPMSIFLSLNLSSTLLFCPTTPLGYSASPSLNLLKIWIALFRS